ncbi:MAG: cytochrome-c peroxidase [Paracoccus sp. (in: a-proteobacteria)]|uniref:cytochrome-c peroxidase n=1 Tax=Paracoccus sp. TaxID=267 RepID=UPI0026E0DBB4|nr:cytochrome-c peroxidase [Paracoccus sp. (in: a-proteobacteria)]MDO5620194.1 cytochrome-c peroxidase [Paracoccus sp. (in: a-proteobacteria)]
MKRILLLTGAALAVASPALAQDAAIDNAALREEALAIFEKIPAEPQPIAKAGADEALPLTPEKVELGKMLYFDPRMSSSQLISCATCHNLSLGGDDELPVSIGHGWQKGPRNAPTVLNSVFNAAQFWDGRAPDLAEQAKGPVQAGVEMSNTPEQVVTTINSMPEYVEAFKAAFPGEADPVTFDNFAHAIEQYEATLITPNSPLDLFMAGDDAAMTDQQKIGMQAFIDTGCTACHYGINLGGQDYHPFGVVAKPGADILPPDDAGRFAVTQTASDEYVFRAAPLRNIALTAPYFHSGQVWDLRQAVQIMSDSQIGTEMSDEDADNIVAFLHALTGDQPEVTIPVLPNRTQDTPAPNPMVPPAPPAEASNG